MVADQPLLELRDVHAGYGDIEILRGISFELTAGSMTSVIGANGAGKSTLLKTVFGTVQTSEGSITYAGEDVTRLTSLDRLRRGIVLIPQGRSNFPEMTVEENLQMGAFIRSDRLVRDDLAAMYDRFPLLRERRRQHAGNLSGGEQQMLEMAMALMLSPKLVLVDEPSLGLSAGIQTAVFDSILELRAAGATVLMVEQNAVQALRISDHGIVVELGRVSAVGTGVQMLEDPDVRRAYLGLA